MDYSEKWGTTVDEAVNLALQDLKVSRDEVEVTILEEPSKGFFGIGAKLALVRVEVKKAEPAPKKEEPKKEQPKAAKAEAPRAEAKKAPKEQNAAKAEKPEVDAPADDAEAPEKSGKKSHKRGSRKDRNQKIERVSQARPDDLQPVTDHPAITFLKEVTEKMGLEVNITASMNDDVIYVDIDGKDSGTVIGKRGQTLDSIQYLTSLVVNKQEDKKYMRVVVDAENYRAKRERTLEQLANRLASKVVKTKRSVRLEPMNPYERKVIHATLQNHASVTTRSEGEEPYRRVIIELK